MVNFIANDDVKTAFKKNKNWIICIAGFFSVVTNICEPIAPFSKYLLVVASVIAVILSIAYFALKKLRIKILPVLLFSIISAFISGVLCGLQSNEDNNRGFLANTIPGVDNLQDYLGIISKDVSEIKKTTSAIKDDTEEIKNATKSIDNKMDVVITNVGKQGGIISNPSTPEEFYHNARIYELNGDYGNAKRAYDEYFKYDNHKLDVHVRYQKFLKIIEGFSGAKNNYFELFGESNNIVDQYSLLLFLEDTEQNEAIKEFLTRYPDFGPGYFQLAKNSSPDVLGRKMGLSDYKNLKENVEKFMEQYDKGNVIKYFLDKEELTRMLNQVAKYEVVVKEKLAEDLTNPVNIIRIDYVGYNHPNEWMILFNIEDYAEEIFYSIDGKAFQSTGMFQAGKKKFPQTKIETRENITKSLAFKYRDLKGREQGPYEFKINSEKLVIDNITEHLKTNCGIAKIAPFDERDNYKLQLPLLMNSHQSYNSYGYQKDPGIIKSYEYDLDEGKFKGSLVYPYDDYYNESYVRFVIPEDFKKGKLQINFNNNTSVSCEKIFN